jgi:hypothetical protein
LPAEHEACRACGAPSPAGQYGGLCDACLAEFGRPFFRGPRALTVMAAGAPLGVAMLVYLEVESGWAIVGVALGAALLVFVGGILIELWRLNRLIARHARR